MKFKTFRLIALGLVIGSLLGMAWCVHSCVQSTPVVSTPAVSVPSATLAPPPPPTRQSLTIPEVQAKVEGWLSAHPSRHGLMKNVNVMPAELFRATAIRFPEPDASRWTTNPDDWNQIRLDLDRDGVDDEKWLLKNGHTYKREILDRSGRTVQVEYFR